MRCVSFLGCFRVASVANYPSFFYGIFLLLFLSLPSMPQALPQSGGGNRAVADSVSSLFSGWRDLAKDIDLSKLPPAALPSVIKALAADLPDRWHARPAGQGSGLRLRNPRHGLQLEFTPGGVQVRGQEEPLLSMRLVSWGYGADSVEVRPSAALGDGPRVQYQHGDNLTEWYVNSSLGVEQGFTITAPPVDEDQSSSAIQEFNLSVELGGSLKPTYDGQTLLFQDAAGETHLSYGKLYSFDAEGNSLPSTLALAGNTLSIKVNVAGAAYPITIDPLLATEKKFLPGDHASFKGVDAIALSGDILAVGTAYQDEGGAVYLFQRHHGGTNNWGEVKRLSGKHGSYFGGSITLRDATLFVGASGSRDHAVHTGAIFVYEKDFGGSDNWGQVTEIFPDNDVGDKRFALRIAISDDLLAAVGETSVGKVVYIFRQDRGGLSRWTQEKIFPADSGRKNRPGSDFGGAIALDNGTLAVGDTRHSIDGVNVGMVYLYQRNLGGDGNWGEVDRVTGTGESRSFGHNISLSGSFLAVGDPQFRADDSKSGLVYLYQRDLGGVGDWELLKTVAAGDKVDGDHFGRNVAITGDTLVVAANYTNDQSKNAGALYLYRRNWGGSDHWGEVKKIVARSGSQYLGWEAIAIDGDTLVAGGHDAAFMFSGMNLHAGTLQFGSNRLSVDENSGNARVAVTREGGSVGAVSVDYLAVNGSAVAGEDYTAVSGRLSWGDGDSEDKIIALPIIDDQVRDPDEAFNLTLSRPHGGATLAASHSAVIMIEDDDGPVWTPVGPRTGAVNALATDPSDSGVVYSGTEGGGVYKSRDGGETWSTANNGLPNLEVRSLAIDPQAPAGIYAGLSSGAPECVTFGSPNTPPVVKGGIYRTANGGETWGYLGLGGKSVFDIAVSPSAPEIMYAAADDDIYKSSDAGQTWVALGARASAYAGPAALVEIAPWDPDTLFAGIGEDVYKSTDGGESWSVSLERGEYSNRIQVLEVDPTTPGVVYVGIPGGSYYDDIGLYKSEDSGGAWVRILGGEIDPSGPSYGESSYDFKLLEPCITPVRLVSDVSAVSEVSQRSLPKGPGKTPRSVTVTLNLIHPSPSWYTGGVHALAIDPSASSTIYAQTDEGVKKSTDGGKVWTMMDAGLSDVQVSALVINSAAPSVVYAGTTDAGGYRYSSVSAGVTFTPKTGLETSEAGAIDSFVARLDVRPTADVTFGLSSSNLNEGFVSPAALTFTSDNWDIPQSVVVTGLGDDLLDDDQVYGIRTARIFSDDPAYSSLDPTDISVVNRDLDSFLLSLESIDSPDPALSGGVVTYTFSYGNKGTGIVTNAILTVTYDSRVTFDSAIPVPDENSNKWILGDLYPGASGTVSLTVTVDETLPVGTPLVAHATLLSDQGSRYVREVTKTGGGSGGPSDTDGDGVDDTVDLDDDGDGLLDEWESSHGLDPLNSGDANLDLDGDGVTNYDEFNAGTDPNDASSLPPPIRAEEYYPLQPGHRLDYVVNGSDSYYTEVQRETVNINGISVVPEKDSMERYLYFTNDAEGLRRHREQGIDWSATFDPPSKNLNPEFEVGDVVVTDGTVTYDFTGSDSYSLSYTSRSEVLSKESVVVPAGTFQAYKVEISTTVYGRKSGRWINETSTLTLWFARHLGLVKYIENFVDTYEMTGAMVEPWLDIKANQEDTFLSVTQGYPVKVMIELFSGSKIGQPVDWWLAAKSPFGRYWYSVNEGWVRSAKPVRAYNGPLVDLLPVIAIDSAELPSGDYTFHFAVDDNRDGKLDATYHSSVDIEIQ